MNRFQLLGDWVDAGGDVVAVLACDPLGRVLVHLRDDFPHVAKPGYWALFGGHVETGETLDAAVVREMAEETGLQFAQTDFVPFARLVSDTGQHHYIYRLIPPVQAADMSLQEGAGFALVHAGQLTQLRLLPEAASILGHFFATS